MRLHRFYVNKPLGEELVVESVGEEKEILHQWHNVFRYKSGDEVFLFSSHAPGRDFLYRIEAISKKECRLALLSTQENLPSCPVTLVMALVKKDTFEQIARHATELGVSKIIPLIATRSEKKSLNFERLRSITLEASEQSSRGTLPEIMDICTPEQAFSLTQKETNIVGSVRGSRTWTTYDGKHACIWVGPEGGWTEEEEEFFRKKGFSLVRTVDTVMRADTAAINLLSVALSSFHFPAA